jgi:hypothetical protein
LPAVAAALLLSIPLVKNTKDPVLAVLERAQRRENCSCGLAGRFFLQIAKGLASLAHLLNSALKLVLSWQVFEQQISAC